MNAFINVSHEQLESSTKLLPLSGVTVAVKDNILTRLMPTTCSSAMLTGRAFVLGSDIILS